ncbi:hypothetical protein BGY98DRAFT_1181593 [Russula aff. rugulosa BPL654]|nr:hypothetical protein BGY98DRAFT_1181593 [Russula aff. rugulosa BPL654]
MFSLKAAVSLFSMKRRTLGYTILYPPVCWFLIIPGHSDLTWWWQADLARIRKFSCYPRQDPHVKPRAKGTRNKPHQSQKIRNNRVEASSRSPRRSAIMPEVSNAYTRAKPAANDIHSRRASIDTIEQSTILYRDHIEKEHPGVNPDLVLGKAAGSRRKATVGREQHFSIKHDRRIQAVSLRPPLIPPAPAAAKATHVPSTFSSAGKDAQPVNGVVSHASRLHPARPGGSTATDYSSRAVTALIPPLPPPTGGYYGSHVVFDPVIESSGVIHPYPFSVASNSYDEV